MQRDHLDAMTDTFRCARANAERRILEILNELTDGTHLDLADVKVQLCIDTDERDEPRRHAVAVRIDLCV